MNTHLFTIQAAPVFLDNDDPNHPVITWITGAQGSKTNIDGDGTGPSHGDPDYQDDTSLHDHHSALNADEDQYIAIPLEIRDAVKQPVLGCQGHAKHGGKIAQFVVGDIGPKNKLGEVSIALANSLGIPSSPTTGGTLEGVQYTIYPGQPANVNGKQYDLQTKAGVEIPTESSSSSEVAELPEVARNPDDGVATAQGENPEGNVQESSSSANP